ncbi:MAG: nucleotidyltransferase [Candidatus Omnitrophica bacterium]|nr:nucleotidyltransferase [Candidatus Omnitrophota bacterium]
MRYPTIFHLISAITKKEGIRCVLVGGFAINYYNVARQTVDVDFLMTKEDFKRISKYLENAGFELDYSQEVFARFKGPDYYLMDIDFMFVDKETLDKILKDSKETFIAKQKFIVPSLNTLIALKLHAVKYNRKLREYKDLPDVINLIRVNRLDYKSKEFRGLCLKYGTEELYNKILKGV